MPDTSAWKGVVNQDEALELQHSADHPVIAQTCDLDGVVADLSDAFVAYPMYQWILADNNSDPSSGRRLFDVLVRTVGYRWGKIYRPKVGGAAAIWIPSEQLHQTSLLRQYGRFPTILRAIGLSRLPRLVRFDWTLSQQHPNAEPHQYLFLIGVRREIQHLGIGSRLLRVGLADADELNRGVFLETSVETNVHFYRKFGFEVVQVYDIAKSAPPTWAMWRRPGRPQPSR